MYNWAEICSELKELEKWIEAKVSLIISKDPDPFTYDRIQTSRKLTSIS
jgi:hypothetical protein